MSNSEVASPLANRHCAACEGGAPPLTQAEIDELLGQLQGWSIVDGMLFKSVEFEDYYQTMAFVNALAWISHRENHHPDLGVHYNFCDIYYLTHAIDALSMNDFICAAKVDALLDI